MSWLRIFTPKTHEAEAGGLQAQSYPELYSEFKGSLSYIERPCLRGREDNLKLNRIKQSLQKQTDLSQNTFATNVY